MALPQPSAPAHAMAPPRLSSRARRAREWKPAEYEDEPTYSHLVEVAKTGRARCRRYYSLPRTTTRRRRGTAFFFLSFREIPRVPTPRSRPPSTITSRCSELIPKGVPRVGVPIKWRGGEYGWISLGSTRRAFACRTCRGSSSRGDPRARPAVVGASRPRPRRAHEQGGGEAGGDRPG